MDYDGVGAPACLYANLCNYNSGYSMGVAPQGKVVSGSYIVPKWDAIGVNSLALGPVAHCSGYGTIDSAYGAGAGSCQTQYATSLCGSCKK